MAEISYRSQIKMGVEPTQDDHVATVKYVKDNAVAVRVSDDAGNIIEERANGIFAECKSTLVWGIDRIPPSGNVRWGVY